MAQLRKYIRARAGLSQREEYNLHAVYAVTFRAERINWVAIKEVD
jgi:hypothetical protein